LDVFECPECGQNFKVDPHEYLAVRDIIAPGEDVAIGAARVDEILPSEKLAIDYQEAARQRAIDYIKKNWGGLGDLPEPLIPVIWATVYRSIQTGMMVEEEGGSKRLLKNFLVGDRKSLPALDEAILRLKFLQKMIPAIRSNPSRMGQRAHGQLLVDILKWGIVDAASMSGLRRTILRSFAKADPERFHPQAIVSRHRAENRL
jgi:hypothetical protein